MRGVPRTLLACVAIALFALALSSCGGDSGDSTATSTGAAEAPARDAPRGGASAAFATPGGDNSIQNFGDEADAAELEAANEILAGYMEARADDDWPAACRHLAEAALAPLEQLATSTPELKGRGCAPILAQLLGNTPGSTRADTMTEGLASLRVDGARGFALYHGAEGVDYFVPMAKEDGEWKVAALAPTEFP